MPTTQERYFKMLMERVSEDEYPSPQLLDRLEAAFWTDEQVIQYVEMLMAKADSSWYPSPQLLDRIHRTLAWSAGVAQ